MLALCPYCSNSLHSEIEYSNLVFCLHCNITFKLVAEKEIIGADKLV